MKNGVTGANETDYHLKNVNPARDFAADVVDVRLATTGDACPECGKGKLQSYKGIEGGHIFILGTRYTTTGRKGWTRRTSTSSSRRSRSSWAATASASRASWRRRSSSTTTRTASAGRSASRRTRCTSSRSAKEANVAEAAEKLYAELWARGVEVLWDDRDERPGVKFKDADLIGLPMRVTIGAKGLATRQRRAEAAHGARSEEVGARPAHAAPRSGSPAG